MNYKTCTHCKQDKPAATEYFYANKQTKCGLQAQCRVCKNAYNKAWQKVYDRSECSRAVRQRYYQTINGYLRHIYSGAKSRCNNSSTRNYNNYGGRGIKCLFESSDQFTNYVTNVLKVDPRGLQIDRIDNDGHYEPGNIRFVTCKENNNNRKKRRKIIKKT